MPTSANEEGKKHESCEYKIMHMHIKAQKIMLRVCVVWVCVFVMTGLAQSLICVLLEA